MVVSFHHLGAAGVNWEVAGYPKIVQAPGWNNAKIAKYYYSSKDNQIQKSAVTGLRLTFIPN